MRWRELGTGLLDLAVIGFAIWTVLYHIGLAADVPTTPLLAVLGLAVVGLLAWGLPRRGPVTRAAGMPRPGGRTGWLEGGTTGASGPPARPGRRAAAWAAASLALAAGAAAVTGTFRLSLALALLAIGATAWAAPWLRTARPAPVRGRGEAVAMVLAAGFAVLSQFILRPDGDDVYYVNRAVWVAQHGRIPVGDVLFSDNGPVLAGQVPVTSFEVFAGALARVLHVKAASLTYYVLLPLATFLAVLALWRLLRLWAHRYPTWCLVLACGFLLFSGGSPASYGSFHLVRSWQGKAIFVSLIVPVLYAYLTEWAETRSHRALTLAVAAGVAGIGLTSSAAFVVPLILGAVGIGLLLRGAWRALPRLALVGVYPVGAGLAVAATVGRPAPGDAFQPADVSWGWVMGPGVLALVGAVALWLGPFLVRHGAGAAIAWGISAMVLVLMAPGVLELLRDTAGSGPVLWRVLWVAPVPALVGLLAALPEPRPLAARAARWATAWVPAVAVLTGLVLAGTPVWAASNRSRLVAEPRWKTYQHSLGEAVALTRAYPHAEVVLAPPGVMSAMTLVTSHPKVVNPRAAYLRLLADGSVRDRRMLSEIAADGGAPPTADQVRSALARLDVDVACAYRGDSAAVALYERSGFGDERGVGGALRCLSGGRSVRDGP